MDMGNLRLLTEKNIKGNGNRYEGEWKTNLKEGKVIKVLDEMVLMSFNEGKKIINKWIWTSTSLKIIKAHKKEDEENKENKIDLKKILQMKNEVYMRQIKEKLEQKIKSKKDKEKRIRKRLKEEREMFERINTEKKMSFHHNHFVRK